MSYGWYFSGRILTKGCAWAPLPEGAQKESLILFVHFLVRSALHTPASLFKRVCVYVESGECVGSVAAMCRSSVEAEAECVGQCRGSVEAKCDFSCGSALHFHTHALHLLVVHLLGHLVGFVPTCGR